MFRADERFAYNNGGFVLLAILAERAAGVPYHQLVHDRVIAPAGMVDTTFQRSDAPQPRTATGYLEAEGLRTNHAPHPAARRRRRRAVLDARGHALVLGRPARRTDRAARRPRRDDPAPQRATGGRPSLGLGFWLPAGGDAIQLEGYDAGISFLSTCRPSTGAVETVISNWTDGAWPIVRFLREVDTGG